MKLLLDEQIPRRLSRHFPDNYVVDHVQQLGWEETKNGALLKFAESSGYDALTSADKNMSYQQNSAVLPISVVVLHVYRLKIEELAPLVPEALEQLKELASPKFIKIGFRIG